MELVKKNWKKLLIAYLITLGIDIIILTIFFWFTDCYTISSGILEHAQCSIYDTQAFGLFPISLFWLIPYAVIVKKPTEGYAFLLFLGMPFILFFLLLFALVYVTIFLLIPQVKKKTTNRRK